MPLPASRAKRRLLAAVSRAASRAGDAEEKRHEYRHRWRPGDWVIWDNRSVMHQANPDYDMSQRRYLYRLMLQGEVPV